MIPIFPDGWYQSNTEEARMIGFNCDYFYGQFSRTGNKIYIRYIYSLQPGKGHVQDFIEGLIRQGWEIIIVQPNEVMEHICKKFKFTEYWEVIEGYNNNNELRCFKYAPV